MSSTFFNQPASLRIGTRDSQLALWQAKTVQKLLLENNVSADIVPIKSEGDIDVITPLYALGVQGVFTRTLDAALLNNRIDIAVHSMKDVPTQLAEGIVQAAVLPRASCKDILVCKSNTILFLENTNSLAIIATGSVRRKAQWLHRYPNHTIENLRGNVNTRLKKVEEHKWDGAVFAAAGLERINLRPTNTIDLDWMLPAPAQGAIMIVCKEKNKFAREILATLNHEATALCTRVERDFLTTLMGGCSTPIGAFAYIDNNNLIFKGNIFSTDGKEKIEVNKIGHLANADTIGITAAQELLQQGAATLVSERKA